MYRPSLLLLSMALVLTVQHGCGRSSESAEPASNPRALPPGNALPPDIDSMLFGSAQACASDDDCPSHVCYYSSCVGLLLADQRWMQITMAEALVAAVADNEALRDRVVQHLDRLLDRAETDIAYRG